MSKFLTRTTKNMNVLKKEYQKGETTIVWEPGKCIHSEKCWRGLIEVFNPKNKPWINVEGASEDRITSQIDQCPSGALSYKELSSPKKENQEAGAKVNVTPNGPLILSSPVQLKFSDGSEKVENRQIALCRCGHSGNKPYCDGSHKRVNFEG